MTNINMPFYSRICKKFPYIISLTIRGNADNYWASYIRDGYSIIYSLPVPYTMPVEEYHHELVIVKGDVNTFTRELRRNYNKVILGYNIIEETSNNSFLLSLNVRREYEGLTRYLNKWTETLRPPFYTIVRVRKNMSTKYTFLTNSLERIMGLLSKVNSQLVNNASMSHLPCTDNTLITNEVALYNDPLTCLGFDNNQRNIIKFFLLTVDIDDRGNENILSKIVRKIDRRSLRFLMEICKRTIEEEITEIIKLILIKLSI